MKHTYCIHATKSLKFRPSPSSLQILPPPKLVRPPPLLLVRLSPPVGASGRNPPPQTGKILKKGPTYVFSNFEKTYKGLLCIFSIFLRFKLFNKNALFNQGPPPSNFWLMPRLASSFSYTAVPYARFPLINPCALSFEIHPLHSVCLLNSYAHPHLKLTCPIVPINLGSIPGQTMVTGWLRACDSRA